MDKKKIIVYALVGFVIFVFGQTLFFKFTGAQETKIIFSTIAIWLNGLGFSAISPAVESYGGYVVGTIELITCILLIIAGTRRLGALVGLGVISGAIFVHLFTPLGVNRVIDEAGNTDGGVLFIMACAVFLCCVLILFLTRADSD